MQKVILTNNRCFKIGPKGVYTPKRCVNSNKISIVKPFCYPSNGQGKVISMWKPGHPAFCSSRCNIYALVVIYTLNKKKKKVITSFQLSKPQGPFFFMLGSMQQSCLITSNGKFAINSGNGSHSSSVVQPKDPSMQKNLSPSMCVT